MHLGDGKRFPSYRTIVLTSPLSLSIETKYALASCREQPSCEFRAYRGESRRAIASQAQSSGGLSFLSGLAQKPSVDSVLAQSRHAAKEGPRKNWLQTVLLVRDCESFLIGGLSAVRSHSAVGICIQAILGLLQ